MSEQDVERVPARELTAEECWTRLEEAPFGRIAAFAAGEVDIFPVNHVVDRGGVDGPSIVFRTTAGTKLLELTIHSHVAFEVDGYTDSDAFSVVVKGEAHEIERRSEVEYAETLGVRPWAPGEKDHWIRIRPVDVRGRAFQR
ncbi:pyridoxamine 5'-phosphate oxidase family protein [Agromyces marinus]|uniref:Pyridoxamine 5'-phosphate oxidase family protein n=1 Tax=Agromyces marinus TaxID=1389020 RepID=A0ABM8H1M8_9MICO|nr:pyridoxamine 5'-phosphate oxidase family protein [Agromyces marinus]UIP57223.1 hypothetical protein DSM26151_00780 [Agromyces marinus]BDZ54688.1 hypothetical protein GCM10025870_17610 [Agromyces marinus]